MSLWERFARICESLGEDLQGFVRLWVSIHEDSQDFGGGFARIRETLGEEWQGFARLW